MKTLLLLSAMLLGILAGRPASAETYPHPDLLLEPAQLATPDVASQFVILDVRTQPAYEQEHIPGARRVDHDVWAKAFGTGLGEDAEAWSQRIGELGIAADSQVVVYDDKGNRDAARIWWILRYWGVRDVRLLNGGWKSWTTEHRPTTAEITPAPATSPFPPTPQVRWLVNKQQMLDLLHDAQFQIVDSRSEKEYCGLDAQKNKRPGKMPGAKHLEWSDLIDQQTQRFKTPEQLRALFEQAGIDLTRPIVSHCQSGGRASVMALGLELMGASDVRNYYRGWSEWGNIDDTPVEREE